MSRPQPVYLRVLGRNPLTDVAAAHQVFERLQARRPQWMPGPIDVEEPVRHRYSPEVLDELWREHSSVFFMPTRRRAGLGGLTPAMGPNRPLGDASLTLTEEELAGDGEDAARGLLTDWAVDLDAVYAHLHLVTPDESNRATNSGAYIDIYGNPGLSFGTADMTRRYLPDLYWLTVWGGPYVELFGRDRLATAPAHEVTEIAPDVFAIQLTEHLGDLRTDHPRLQAVRDRVKAHLQDHLDPPVFYDPARGPNRPYTTINLPWPPTRRS